MISLQAEALSKGVYSSGPGDPNSGANRPSWGAPNPSGGSNLAGQVGDSQVSPSRASPEVKYLQITC